MPPGHGHCSIPDMRVRWWPCVVLAFCAACAAKTDLDTRLETGPPLEVTSFELTGVTSIDEDQLRSVLRTSASSWLPWTRDQPFDRRTFAADLERIVAFYRDQGFPDARVADYDLDIDQARSEVAIRVHVIEGLPRTLDAVTLLNFDVLDAETVATIRDRWPLAVGEPIEISDVLASVAIARDALRERGFPYAEVDVDDDALATGRLVFTADPGPQAWFGEIEIRGNVSVDDEVIRRELAYQPGQPFALSALRDSQRQLYALDLFRFATVEMIDRERRPAEVRTRVTVAEGKHQQVEFSLGYGTEEKFRGELRWRHRNFLGAARTLGVRGGWSSLNRGAEVDLVQPYAWHRSVELGLNAHYWHATEPAYTLTARGGRVTLTGAFAPLTAWSLVVTGENSTSVVEPILLQDPEWREELIAIGLNPETGIQSGLLTSIAVSGLRTTTDSELDPQHGYQLSAHLEKAGSWLPGVFDFLEWRVGGRHYLPVGERVVIATRAEAATIDPSGESAALPFGQRYFLGGSTSLRGWGRYEVAPLTRDGLPVGGNSLFDSSAELRVRVRGALGVAVFADAGNVWRTEWQYDFRDLKADAGAGLRYFTVVGPVRLDVAWQLTPIPGLVSDGELQSRRWRVHFSIGQAF